MRNRNAVPRASLEGPLVAPRSSLETLRRKLGEAEELYITVFRHVNSNYGDETAEREPLEAA